MMESEARKVKDFRWVMMTPLSVGRPLPPPILLTPVFCVVVLSVLLTLRRHRLMGLFPQNYDLKRQSPRTGLNPEAGINSVTVYMVDKLRDSTLGRKQL